MVEASSWDLRLKNAANRPAIPWLLPRQRAQADLLKSENGTHHDRGVAAGRVQDRRLPGHDAGAEDRVQVARHPGASRPRTAVHNATTRYFRAER